MVAQHAGLIAAMGGYLGGAAWMLPAYRWQINPDGVGYLTVARSLLHGEFHDAINAYWSPLVSWLVVPLLACGLEAVLAFKLMSLALGAAGIAAAWWLMGNLGVPRLARTLATFALVPLMLGYALQVITSDLAAAIAIVGYLAHVTDPRRDVGVRGGICTGLWMALAYLAKAYALWFVVAHQALITAVELRDWVTPQARRAAALRAGLALLVFAAVSTAWASVLTAKYGDFTFGSTGRYNWAYNGPDFQLPTHSRGLMAPPNPSAVSAWDDPTDWQVAGWNPLTPQRNRAHFRQNLERNYEALLALIDSSSALAWFIVIGALLVMSSAAEPRPGRPHTAVVLAMLLYPCAYLLFHLEARFFWILPILLVILSASVPVALARVLPLGGGLGGLLFTAVVAATFAIPACLELAETDTAGRDVRATAEWLEPAIPAGARVASTEGWDLHLYVAFHNDLRYFGMTRRNATAAQVKAQLDEHEIEYFLVTAGQEYPFLEGKSPIVIDAPAPNPRAKKIEVYRLR